MGISNPFKIFTSSADPSIDFRAKFTATKLLLQPWKWRSARKLEASEKEFADYFGFSSAFGFNRGREALYILLKSLGIGKGDEVIVQAFTCEALIAGILWAGATPIYADIDETFNLSPHTVRPKITGKTKALIVQHTFGIPAKIHELKKLCDKEDILLIEDIAHALGVKDHETEDYLGLIGIACFTSFGQDKKISAQGGGMLFTNDLELATKIKSQHSRLGFIPTTTALKKLLKTIIFYFALRLYYFAGLGKLLIFLSRKLGLAGRPVEKVASEKLSALTSSDEKRFVKKLHPLQAQLAAAQLKNFEDAEAHRNEISNVYIKNLDPHFTVKASQPFLRFPLLIETANKQETIKALKKARVLVGEWYTEPILRFGTDWQTLKYKPGTCKNVEAYNKKILNLPTHKLVSKSEAFKIANIINQSNGKA